jgi:voltage-gated potassium channel
MTQSDGAQTAPLGSLSTARQWWLVVRGLLRAAANTVVMVALYFILPLEHRSGTYIVLVLVLGIVLLAGMIAWQLRAIIRSSYPAIRAIQALASATALFLLLFASAYFTMSVNEPGTFSEPLSRSDALYFTITVFSTVGFGDITALGETARLVVTTQMLLDLLILGLGIQVILGAVRRGRARGA